MCCSFVVDDGMRELGLGNLQVRLRVGRTETRGSGKSREFGVYLFALSFSLDRSLGRCLTRIKRPGWMI